LPAQGSLFAHVVNIALNLTNAVADAAAVCFKFLFTRSTNADATRSSAAALAAQPGHCGSLAGKPRQHVVELRKLDLQLAFAAARVSRKNIENELGTINHSALGVLFDVALLHRREITVENNERSFFGVRFGADFVEFAAANERRRVSSIAELKHRSCNFRAGAARQLDQFGQRFPLGRTRRPSRDAGRALPCDSDKKCAFGGGYGPWGLHGSGEGGEKPRAR